MQGGNVIPLSYPLFHNCGIFSFMQEIKLLITFLAILLTAFGVIDSPDQLQLPTLISPTPKPTSVLGDQTSMQPAQVVKVVDGDTIRVSFENKEETIRMIGINTPETVDPRREVECFGKEASARLKELINGKYVLLEADESQDDRDRYGRLLRYVWLDQMTNINKVMVAEGFAYEYTYDLPYKYQSEFKTAQQNAQLTKKGLWAEGTCNGKK